MDWKGFDYITNKRIKDAAEFLYQKNKLLEAEEVMNLWDENQRLKKQYNHKDIELKDLQDTVKYHVSQVYVEDLFLNNADDSE